MGVRHPAGETITVTRPGTPTGDDDDAGNPEVGPPSTFTIRDVAIAPSSGSSGVAASKESAGASGTQTTTSFVLYCPPGTELFADDRLAFRGVDGWQVEGDSRASDWRSPFDGGERGVVVGVRRAS